MTNAKKGIIIGVIALVIGLLVFTGCSPKEEPKTEEIAISEETAIAPDEEPKGEDPVDTAKNGVKITPEEYRYTKQNREKKPEKTGEEGVPEADEKAGETINTASSSQPNTGKSDGNSTANTNSTTNTAGSGSSSSGTNSSANSGGLSNSATTNQSNSNSGSLNSSSGTSSSSSGNSESNNASSSGESNDSSSASSGGSSAPAPAETTSHTHNYVPGIANFDTGDRIDACSCGSTTNTRGTWVVDSPAQEEVWIDVPVYVTLKLVTVYNGPNSVVYESYSMEEAQYWMNTHPAEWGNYIITYPSVIDHYDRVLSTPAREEVGHYEWY